MSNFLHCFLVQFQKGDYGTVSEVAGDLNVMFENAKKYNRPDSKLYKVIKSSKCAQISSFLKSALLLVLNLLCFRMQ